LRQGIKVLLVEPSDSEVLHVCTVPVDAGEPDHVALAVNDLRAFGR
jgi:hypothetical protein